MQRKLKQILSAFIFLLLAFEIFVHCTYLFRNTDRAARQNILGLYYEENNSLDVVFVGPSSVYRYWDPMKAWDLFGFTSYDFSTSAMSRATILTAIKDLRRSQSPNVIVVDVRPLLNSGRITEIGYSERNPLDSFDYSFTRLQGIKYLFDNSDISAKEIGTEYMELAQYHNNKSALAEELNWQLIDNRLNDLPDGEGFYKGFAIAAKHTYQSQGAVHLTDTVAEEVSELYTDILEYGKKEKLALLFTASPQAISERQSSTINKMELLAKEYGYGFIDGSRLWKEMNLDFTTDFYNPSHVNILGAEKWTEYVGNYLIQNYHLPDHRADSAYHSWNMVYEQYKKEAEAAMNLTWELIDAHNAVLESEKAMRQITDFMTWFGLANNSNISLLVCKDSSIKSEVLNSDLIALKQLGIDERCMEDSNTYYALYCNGNILSNTSDVVFEGIIGELETSFLIQKDKGEKLILGEREWVIPQNKISLICFDNNLNQVVDFIELELVEKGNMQLKHLDYQ